MKMNQTNQEDEYCLTILPEELESLCRSCLNKNGAINLFQSDYKGLLLCDLFMVFCQVEAEASDGLPQKVCDACASFLVQFYMFKEKVQRSHMALEVALDKENNAIKMKKLKDIPKEEKVQESDENLDNYQIQETLHIINEEDDIKPLVNGEIVKSEQEDEVEFEDNEIKFEITDSNTHICSFCKIKFTSESVYNLHMEKEYELRKEDKCIICEELVSKVKLKEHLEEHVKNDGMVCRICDKKFSHDKNVARHILTHFDKTHQCHICGKTVSKATNLDEHIRTHFGERTKACDICDKKFVTSHALNEHKYLHKLESGEVQPKVCKLCNKVVRRRGLSSHMAMHREKQLCSECGKKFSNRANLRRHLQDVHQKRQPYACRICNKRFSQNTTLKSHMRIHTGEKPHLCSECGRRFTNKSYLKFHMNTHNQNKKSGRAKHCRGIRRDTAKIISCKYCGKNFAYQYHLRIHMQQHSIKKPYICFICHKTFVQRNSLNIHMQYHNEDRLFACDICPKTFMSSVAVKLHRVKKHTNNQTYYKEKGAGEDLVRSFTCPACPRKFIYRWNLEKHIKVHAKEKKFSCNVCFSLFKDTESLDVHKKSEHEENFEEGTFIYLGSENESSE